MIKFYWYAIGLLLLISIVQTLRITYYANKAEVCTIRLGYQNLGIDNLQETQNALLKNTLRFNQQQDIQRQKDLQNLNELVERPPKECLKAIKWGAIQGILINANY